jgi:hypothetical protein
MKTIQATVLAAAFGCSAVAQAADFSFTGTFTQDDNVQLFNFVVGAPSNVTLRTWSYAGGVNAAGATIARGGFDPILALFDSTGLQINQNDDGGASVPVDLSGARYDTFLTSSLAAGSYTVSVMEFNNFSIGPNLSNGFTRTGEGNFTGGAAFNPACASVTSFCDVSGNTQFNARTRNWAFDVLNVAGAEIVPRAVPVPAALPLLAAGLGVFGFFGRRRKN